MKKKSYGNIVLKVVVNADDFGLSENVTTEISNLFYPKGIITSSTIIANTPHLTRVKSIVEANPDISFGIHLNITEGLCMSRNRVFRKLQLVDDKWNFITSSCKKLEYQHCDAELLDAIYKEWCLQIDTLIAVGIVPDHIDGHHHCHTWYGLSIIAMRIAQKYNINSVRNIMSHKALTMKDRVCSVMASAFYKIGLNFCDYRGKWFVNNRISKVFDAYQSRYVFSRLLHDNKMKTTDLFCDYDAFKSFENDDKVKVVELMCHPGHPKCVQQTERISRDSYQLKNSMEIVLSNYKSLLS